MTSDRALSYSRSTFLSFLFCAHLTGPTFSPHLFATTGHNGEFAKYFWSQFEASPFLDNQPLTHFLALANHPRHFLLRIRLTVKKANVGILHTKILLVGCEEEGVKSRSIRLPFSSRFLINENRITSAATPGTVFIRAYARRHPLIRCVALD